MKAVRTLFVLLNVGVAAPAAASPGAPVATWPGVSDVLLNVVAAPVAACSSCGLNDSDQPGSVLVFPKYRVGLQTTTENQGNVPNTEFEISVKCPNDADCSEALPDFPMVHLKGHWVCHGDMGPTQPGICHENDFEVTTTVNGTLYLTTECLADPTLGTPPFCVNQANGIYTRIPRPPCEQFPEQQPGGFNHRNEAYLIVWVVNAGGNPIKFDGLVGDAILRVGAREETQLETYNALPIQAGELFSTGDQTAADIGGALAFDGFHYKQVTGTIIGTVRYPGLIWATAAEKGFVSRGRIITKLTLLTLDVRSNRVNDVTYVDLMFYNEAEVPHSASTTFVCYITRDLDGSEGDRPPIDPFLNNSFGRKGLVVSGPAQRSDGTRVSLVGLLEVLEEAAIPTDRRAYANPLYNDGTPVTTTFFPSGVLP
jgi:hypothetical protein